MSELRELYQEVILDHNRNPRNFGPLADANRHAEGFNPLCGDRVTVYLKVEDGVVRDIHFEGAGCAISTASASVMTQAIKGKPEAEAAQIFEGFRDMITGHGDAAALGKLKVFAGVAEYPTRVKCAVLCWHTFMAALHEADEPVTTE